MKPTQFHVTKVPYGCSRASEGYYFAVFTIRMPFACVRFSILARVIVIMTVVMMMMIIESRDGIAVTVISINCTVIRLVL